MAWDIQVTEANVAEVDIVAEALHSHLQEVLKEVQEYPVEIYVAGYRVTLETEDDVRELLAWLQSEVRAIRAA